MTSWTDAHGVTRHDPHLSLNPDLDSKGYPICGAAAPGKAFVCTRHPHGSSDHRASDGEYAVFATWPHVNDQRQIVQPDHVEGETIQQRFESFHALNPWVLDELEKLTADWRSRGHKRLGIGMLTEVLRWQYGRQTVGDDFKLNNNMRSRYVRLMIERHPEWADMFELRRLKTA